jgi:hypothetical protein
MTELGLIAAHRLRSTSCQPRRRRYRPRSAPPSQRCVHRSPRYEPPTSVASDANKTVGSCSEERLNIALQPTAALGEHDRIPHQVTYKLLEPLPDPLQSNGLAWLTGNRCSRLEGVRHLRLQPNRRVWMTAPSAEPTLPEPRNRGRFEHAASVVRDFRFTSAHYKSSSRAISPGAAAEQQWTERIVRVLDR